MGVLQNREELWMNKLKQVKEYIDTYNRKPSHHDKNKIFKSLGYWIIDQQKKYKNKEYIMRNQEIYNIWIQFINDPLYLVYFQPNEDIWNDNFNQVKKYIDTYNKRPLKDDNDKNVKLLAKWISYQQTNYKNKEHIMKNEKIYNIWIQFINDPLYLIYFQSNEDIWKNNLNQVKKYIDTYNKILLRSDKDKNIKNLAIWIITQQQNYKTKEKIMKIEKIYNIWKEFINNPLYQIYFQSNEENWINNLNQVKKYIDTHNKILSFNDNDKNIKTLRIWITNQQKNYKNKEQIMKNKEIYNKWTEFINDTKYKEYFKSNKDNWYELLNKVIHYIDINKKRPSTHDKDRNIKIISTWINHQQNNYKNKTEIMKNEEIYNKWTKFINNDKYKQYF
jgi:hypothetical protein